MIYIDSGDTGGKFSNGFLRRKRKIATSVNDPVGGQLAAVINDTCGDGKQWQKYRVAKALNWLIREKNNL